MFLYGVHHIANNLYQKYISSAGFANILGQKAFFNFVNPMEQDTVEENETNYF
jgi:hypothetical protein